MALHSGGVHADVTAARAQTTPQAATSAFIASARSLQPFVAFLGLWRSQACSMRNSAAQKAQRQLVRHHMHA
jgi:hypothetical protein